MRCCDVQESIMFDVVHQTFIDRMAQLADIKYIVKACTHPGMLDVFNDMDAKLEKIQKSLENYLEAKRQQFPRFYFLSSDDLLEILGSAKDPQNVQSHLKKCFEGIKKLDMYAPGTDGRRTWEASAVNSPDGYALQWMQLHSQIECAMDTSILQIHFSYRTATNYWNWLNFSFLQELCINYTVGRDFSDDRSINQIALLCSL